VAGPPLRSLCPVPGDALQIVPGRFVKDVMRLNTFFVKVGTEKSAVTALVWEQRGGGAANRRYAFGEEGAVRINEWA